MAAKAAALVLARLPSDVSLLVTDETRSERAIVMNMGVMCRSVMGGKSDEGSQVRSVN